MTNSISAFVQLSVADAFVWSYTRFVLVTGVTEHLLTVTASNYSGIANSHSLQFPKILSRDNAVGIAAGYGLDDWEFESR
jgi:hypothetical protein